MKLSKLICDLNALKQSYGDINVVYRTEYNITDLYNSDYVDDDLFDGVIYGEIIGDSDDYQVVIDLRQLV